MTPRSLLGAASLVPALLSAQPTGDSIIRAMHDRYAGVWYHTLAFTQKTTLRTPADTMVVETWKEIGMFPGHLRVDIARATGPMVAIYAGDSLFFARGDSTVARVAARNILLIMGFDVYVQRAEATLAELQAERYPMMPVREDTWEGRRVYVIGDAHSRQLWIDKDRLLFMRSFQPNPRDSTKTDEYRFDDYVKRHDGWIAVRVVTYSDGKVVQKEEYTDVRTGIPVDSAIFRPPHTH